MKALSAEPRMEDNSRWRRTLLPATATVQHAIRCLDESALQIALVVADDGTLTGTLTDGDVRRALLRGLSLDSSIDTMIQRNPVVVPAHMGTDLVLRLMRANRLHQLPIVDDERRVLGLHVLDELMDPGKRDNLMVILAGGKGARLRPYTENCPKPLLQVGDKPMLEHILERARAEGFTRYVLAVHYLGHMIEEYFGDGSKWDVRIEYLREESPLGTAGALGLLSPRPDAPFLVTNGDVLTDIRYGEILDFHCLHGAAATMAVRQHEWQHPFGVVRTEGVDIVGFEEKPIARSHINAGIYVLEPRAQDVLPPNTACDMPLLFSRLQDQGERTIVYPMHEPWFDIGRIEDLERAR